MLRPAAAGVALAGMAVAGYLTWAHYANGSVVCVVGGSCEDVQSSEYASVLDVPVALLGLGTYSTVLALMVWDVATARLAAATIALVGMLFSVYLLIVQLVVIDAICTWCLANDVAIAPALALLTGLRLRA